MMVSESEMGDSQGTDLSSVKQSLKISLAEKEALEAEKYALELEVQRLKGEQHINRVELQILRQHIYDALIAPRDEIRLGAAIRSARALIGSKLRGFTVPTTDFTVPTDK